MEIIEKGMKVYHGEKVKMKDSKEIDQLIQFSNEYQLIDLLESLKSLITKQINIENCSTYLLVAQQLNMNKELNETIEPFFLKNFSKISQTESFLNLTKEILMKHLNNDNLDVGEDEIEKVKEYGSVYFNIELG